MKLKLKAKVDATGVFGMIGDSPKQVLIKGNVYETEDQSIIDKMSGNFTVIVENNLPYYISTNKESNNYFEKTFELIEVLNN